MKKEEIVEIIKRDNVKFVKLMFVDLSGTFKTVEISSKEIDSALNNKIMIDGSNIEGLSNVEAADMMLCPDKKSFRRAAFYDSEFGNVALLMCDVATPDGKVAAGCTRSNLKNGLLKMKKAGFEIMNVGFEPEFFIFSKKPSSDIYPAYLLDNSSHCADETTDATMKLRREIMYNLEIMGIHPLTSHHERATSQYEITYRYSDALTACDNILLAKMIIKEIAKKHGLYATFMPKPISNLTGNGLHTNISLIKDGKNAFASDNEPISSIGKTFIAGVLKHAKGLCLLTNPTINSYKRLGVSGFEAPINICYGEANRTAMIRVPLASGNSARAEIRSTDAASNPYLAISGILAAGLFGIKNNLVTSAVNRNAGELGLDKLPSSLTEAITEFEKDELIKNSVTPSIATLLIKKSKTEVDDYYRLVNSFDFDRYF